MPEALMGQFQVPRLLRFLRGGLARIMHHAAHFCTSARRTRAAGRSARTGLLPLAVQRVWG